MYIYISQYHLTYPAYPQSIRSGVGTYNPRRDAQHREAACYVQRTAAREEPGDIELVDPWLRSLRVHQQNLVISPMFHPYFSHISPVFHHEIMVMSPVFHGEII